MPTAQVKNNLNANDSGYSDDEQMCSFIRWSLSQDELQKLAIRINSLAKQIKSLVGEAILQRDGLLDVQFWQQIYKLLEIDDKTTHPSVLRDVRSLVTIMCQSLIKLYTQQRKCKK